jgi:hypothetical protein
MNFLFNEYYSWTLLFPTFFLFFLSFIFLFFLCYNIHKIFWISWSFFISWNWYYLYYPIINRLILTTQKKNLDCICELIPKCGNLDIGAPWDILKKTPLGFSTLEIDFNAPFTFTQLFGPQNNVSIVALSNTKSKELSGKDKVRISSSKSKRKCVPKF